MAPQYEKTQYYILVFSGPLLKLFKKSEGEKWEYSDATCGSGLACNFPPIVPNQVPLNILVCLLCTVR